MVGGSVNDANACVCLYNNGMLPSRELLPDYSKPSPPIFSLISPNNGTALGLSPNSNCDAEELSVELQKPNSSPRQQFQLTYDGRIVSVFCPERVLSVKPENDACVSGSPLRALGAVFDTTSSTTLQRWNFNSDGNSFFRPEKRIYEAAWKNFLGILQFRITTLPSFVIISFRFLRVFKKQNLLKCTTQLNSEAVISPKFETYFW